MKRGASRAITGKRPTATLRDVPDRQSQPGGVLDVLLDVLDRIDHRPQAPAAIPKRYDAAITGASWRYWRRIIAHAPPPSRTLPRASPEVVRRYVDGARDMRRLELGGRPNVDDEGIAPMEPLRELPRRDRHEIRLVLAEVVIHQPLDFREP
jgi:hypothetical protein